MEEVEEDREGFRQEFSQIAKDDQELLDDMQGFLDIMKLMRENKDVLKDLKE